MGESATTERSLNAMLAQPSTAQMSGDLEREGAENNSPPPVVERTYCLLSSSSRTKSGARTPCVLKLAASSLRLSSSKRFRGLLTDSVRAATGTSRYSLLFFD